MAIEKVTREAREGVGFKLFSRYLRFFHNVIYYRKVYWINTENIPEEGPLMIVSDHQNCLSDALALLMAIFRSRKKRQHRILSRADVFKPIVSKPLRWLGIMPAFRMEYDGAETLSNNTDTFNESEEELLQDGTLIIYPEAGHQDKRWLGTFSYGYTRLIFNAAAKGNFEKEMFILPSCNHYSDYFNPREDVLIKFGTPISLAPFYELYKTKPRTAQRQVNALVREQISSMMLDITDLENYEAIDYIRNTYGNGYARKKGSDPDKLPEKLLADKQLFAALQTEKEEDEERVTTIYNDARRLEQETKRLKINDADFEKRTSVGKLFLQGIGLLLLSPLFLLACITYVPIHYAPRIPTRKLTDMMFYSGIYFAFSILISIPIMYAVTFALVWIVTKSALIALIYLICLPFLGIFAGTFLKYIKRWWSTLRFRSLLKQGKLSELSLLRDRMFASIDELLK